ncbi:hypothetical protein E9229_000013 [Paeniglutamicibacter cryotolerans]|uniref:Uncharacterized protein n=1 Tax=Paeniglutamicibacter cryotolerans TaxID=670079 RepID=A0A839QKX6_9MICC|nr:hypothetical protein [Paeniglutamicibacter cryotolerans]
MIDPGTFQAIPGPTPNHPRERPAPAAQGAPPAGILPDGKLGDRFCSLPRQGATKEGRGKQSPPTCWDPLPWQMEFPGVSAISLHTTHGPIRVHEIGHGTWNIIRVLVTHLVMAHELLEQFRTLAVVAGGIERGVFGMRQRRGIFGEEAQGQARLPFAGSWRGMLNGPRGPIAMNLCFAGSFHTCATSPLFPFSGLCQCSRTSPPPGSLTNADSPSGAASTAACKVCFPRLMTGAGPRCGNGVFSAR